MCDIEKALKTLESMDLKNTQKYDEIKDSCMKEFEEFPMEYCEYCSYNNHDPEVGIFNQCTRNQWE